MIAVPVFSRRRHEIGYTIQKLKRQTFASSPIDTRKLSRAIDFANVEES